MNLDDTMDFTVIIKDLHILIGIIIIIISTTVITKIFSRLMKKRETYDRDMTAAILIKDIITYSIYFVALMYILQFFGVNLAGTLLSLGIVGIAVSFAAKDIISNLFSGIILILGKSIKVGDTIEIDGKKGTVESIAFRSTVIVDNLGVRDHIPNSTITNNPYYEFKPDELRRVDVCIGLPLYVDVVDFEEYITKKIVTYDAIDNTHRPLVFANKTDFWEVEVKVSFWVKDVDSENRWQLIINARDKYKLIIVNDIRKYIRTVGEKK